MITLSLIKNITNKLKDVAIPYREIADKRMYQTINYIMLNANTKPSPIKFSVKDNLKTIMHFTNA